MPKRVSYGFLLSHIEKDFLEKKVRELTFCPFQTKEQSILSKGKESLEKYYTMVRQLS